MTDQTLMTATTETPTASSDGANTPVAEATEGAAQTQQNTDPAAQAAPVEGEAEAAPDASTEGEEGEDKGDEGAPESYEDFAVPEGVALDDEVLGSFTEAAKELNLPQAQAQKIVDLGVQMSQKWAEQAQANVTTMQNEWLDQAKADKEFGGDDAALAQNLAIGKKALDAYGTPELRELLEQSRLGDHPEVIRFFYRAGKTISEDGMVTAGGEPSGSTKSLADRLYS